MFKLCLLLLAMAMAANAVTRTPFTNLGQPLPVAPSGLFNGSRAIGTSKLFNGTLAECDVYYAGGATTIDTPDGGFYGTFVAFRGACTMNETVVIVDGHPVLIHKGRTVEINLFGELSTAACGLSNQIGMAYGVLGGRFDILGAEVNRTNIPLCFYYTRLSSTSTQRASINLALYDGIFNGDQTVVQCPSARPPIETNIISVSNLTCLGAFGQTYNCLNSPMSRCINNSRAISEIGIGMSVGGIGLLLTTLGMIIVIQRITGST